MSVLMSVEGFLTVGVIGAVALLVAAIVGAAVAVVLSVWVRAVWMVVEILRELAAENLPKATARNRWSNALKGDRWR